jgi:hypothetical protein
MAVDRQSYKRLAYMHRSFLYNHHSRGANLGPLRPEEKVLTTVTAERSLLRCTMSESLTSQSEHLADFPPQSRRYIFVRRMWTSWELQSLLCLLDTAVADPSIICWIVYKPYSIIACVQCGFAPDNHLRCENFLINILHNGGINIIICPCFPAFIIIIIIFISIFFYKTIPVSLLKLQSES